MGLARPKKLRCGALDLGQFSTCFFGTLARCIFTCGEPRHSTQGHLPTTVFALLTCSNAAEGAGGLFLEGASVSGPREFLKPSVVGSLPLSFVLHVAVDVFEARMRRVQRTSKRPGRPRPADFGGTPRVVMFLGLWFWAGFLGLVWGGFQAFSELTAKSRSKSKPGPAE